MRKRATFAALAVGAAAMLGVATPACIDPVHADAVAALGPEAAGVREGPEHRPGQPCFTCHGGLGPGPDFASAGTVYAVRGGTQALPGVTVVLRDATGSEQRRVTNDVGNFYITVDEWTPTFPLHVQLEYRGAVKEMTTRLGRDGGCATCHQGSGDSAKMPAVYMSEK